MRKELEKIYARKDGRFEIRYHYGYKDDGKPNYRSVYGNTKKEVINQYHQVMNTLISNNDLLIYDKSYIGYDINEWLNSAKIRNKKSTYSNYQYTIQYRIIPKFANIKRKAISLEYINRFTFSLLNEGLMEKTVKDILVILKQILNYGDIHLKIPMPKVPKHEIQILKNEEQEKLEKEIMKNLNEKTFGIYLCLYTGLRIGEVCALQWKNIDLKNKKLMVKKTLIRIKNPNKNIRKKTIIIMDDPKSSSSIREIPIPDFLIPIMKQFGQNITPDTFFISGTEKCIEPRTYFNKYKKILTFLNLEMYNFHCLRHTFATRCIENGCDPKTLSEILGHSSVKITLERYVHPSYKNKVMMMNQLKPLFL